MPAGLIAFTTSDGSVLLNEQVVRETMAMVTLAGLISVELRARVLAEVQAFWAGVFQHESTYHPRHQAHTAVEHELDRLARVEELHKLRAGQAARRRQAAVDGVPAEGVPGAVLPNCGSSGTGDEFSSAEDQATAEMVLRSFRWDEKFWPAA